MLFMVKTSKSKGVDPKLLEILVCPVSKQNLYWDFKKQELTSTVAGLAYPVKDGVPVLLVEEARQLTAEERKGV